MVFVTAILSDYIWHFFSNLQYCVKEVGIYHSLAKFSIPLVTAGFPWHVASEALEHVEETPGDNQIIVNRHQ